MHGCCGQITWAICIRMHRIPFFSHHSYHAKMIIILSFSNQLLYFNHYVDLSSLSAEIIHIHILLSASKLHLGCVHFDWVHSLASFWHISIPHQCHLIQFESPYIIIKSSYHITTWYSQWMLSIVYIIVLADFSWPLPSSEVNFLICTNLSYQV